MDVKAQGMSDARKLPQIPSWQIFLSIILAVFLRKRSILQMEQTFRLSSVKKFVGRNRKQIASDRTLQRVFPLWDLTTLREYAYYIFLRARLLGQLVIKEPLVRGLRIGVIDGTVFGKFMASCFAAIGEQVNIWVDLEPITKRGKELVSSKKLVKRLVDRLGKKFVDIVLLDGLYVAKDFIKKTLASGIDVLIKTTEEGLNIIKEAESIFKHRDSFKGSVEEKEGFDEIRGVLYKVLAAVGFNHQGIKMKVAKVWEKEPKRAEEQVFWVLTTNQDLSGLAMRELAHIRWHIENNGFKDLSEHVNSKHVWTHDPLTFQVITLMLFVGWNLFDMYQANLSKENIRKEYAGVHITKAFVSMVLTESLMIQYGSRSP